MARAVSPVVGVGLLVVVTMLIAGAAGAAVLALDAPTPTEGLALSVTVDADADRITVAHGGGPALDVREISLSIRVADRPLEHQPPIPYFAAEGFVGAPSGPFNQAADPRWSVGERASLGIASTNGPRPAAGDRVMVTVARDGRVLVRTSAIAT